jgi:hypothetical protein
MKVAFRVHGVAEGRANVATEVDGETLQATVPCLEVELVTESVRHGNQTLRFTGSQMEEAKELFQKDAKIIGDFYEADDE